MKLHRPYCLKEIAEITDAKIIGDSNIQILGFNEIHRAETGDMIFVDHPKYYGKALESKASVVLINMEVECPEGKALLYCKDPFSAFNVLTNFFLPYVPLSENISPSAKIGMGTVIEHGVIIGHNVEIGENCIIQAAATICSGTKIGNRVSIGKGTVIGGEAFYYKKREEGYERMLSSGNVVLEDDVEIGSGCTVDRGVSADTRIGKGTKIDNLVHIGHDTVVGKNCLFASQVGIAGCVRIGDGVTLWGQVGIASSIEIGEKAVVLAQSGVSKSLKGGKVYFGYPAGEAMEQNKQMAFMRLLPKILREKGIIK